MTQRQTNLFKKIAAVAGLTLSLTLTATQAFATFPDKPIQFISPFAAGGANDYLTRLMAQHMATELKGTIVAENKTGANGIVGATFVAKSAPDGYAVLTGNSATHGTNPTLYPKLPYDAVKDFAPISMVGFVPLTLSVDIRLGINNIAELIAYGKKNPGKLAFSSSGVGSTGHLAGEAFKAASGIDMVHAPYKGDAPAIGDVAAGQIALSFVGVASASALYQSGKIKVLAVASAKRSTTMPDVPTFAEAGFKDIEISQWFALFTRAGTPKETIDLMNAAAKNVLSRPEIQKGIITQGAEYQYSTPEQLAAFTLSEIKRFGDIIRRLNIKVD
jgi:tripartite-type tricarboxylate transporter receptor subunit TctC